MVDFQLPQSPGERAATCRCENRQRCQLEKLASNREYGDEEQRHCAFSEDRNIIGTKNARLLEVRPNQKIRNLEISNPKIFPYEKAATFWVAASTRS
jgi:hypothetical protein